jgi:hypothetical protein
MNNPWDAIKYEPQGPIVSCERPHMYYDVDSTLVRPIYEEHEVADLFIRGVGYVKNDELIYEMEVARSRGHVIVVWSQGGAAWANTVVRELKLEPFVDFVLAKPSWFADDKPADEILDSSRRFFREF